MCDFLNDYYDEPFSVKSCSPNGEYYKYSKPQKPQFQGPRNLMVSGGKKTNELDRYNIIHSIQPQPIVIGDKIQIDRHDVLVALLFIIIIIIVKLLISMYKINTRLEMYYMNRPVPRSMPMQQTQQQTQQQTPIELTQDQKIEQGIQSVDSPIFS
uniref:Uncharacterized protein n=1 Tax=viral metagenome TaxID=1070528 RepID=A0A6C0BBY9_9ZZZZ